VKQGLNTTCRTVALSLGVSTSENQLAILSVVGHWLTADFEKKEKLLEFMEIEGVHSLRVTTPEIMGHYASFCIPRF
jgi:hypothetical protein